MARSCNECVRLETCKHVDKIKTAMEDFPYNDSEVDDDYTIPHEFKDMPVSGRLYEVLARVCDSYYVV